MARLRSCRVSLSPKERKIIRHLLKKAASSNARTRYAILLAADENRQNPIPTNSEIASASGASIPTVIDTLKKYCPEGIAGIEQLRQELKAWNDSYDKVPSPVNWQFTAQDSRIKLKKLYPDIDKIREERDNRQKTKACASMSLRQSFLYKAKKDHLLYPKFRKNPQNKQVGFFMFLGILVL